MGALEGADPPVRRQIVYVALDAISGYDRVMTAQSTAVIASGVLLLLVISFIIAALMLIIKAHIRWKLRAVYRRAEVAGVKGHLEERAKKSATLVAARDGKLSEMVKKAQLAEVAKRANVADGAEVVVLVFAVSDKQSFDAGERWLQDVRASGLGPTCTLVLVGNKADVRVGSWATPYYHRRMIGFVIPLLLVQYVM